MGVGDGAVDRLRALLTSGDYPPQARLPPERDLTRHLGVSRRALREGLAVLEAEGVLWRHVGRGTFVGPRLPAPGGGLPLVTAQTSPADLMDLFLWLEPAMARAAATRATPLDIDNLRYLLDKNTAAHDPETWDVWDTRLHRAIAEAAHNVLALAVFDSVNAVRDAGAWRRLREDPVTEVRFAELSDHHHRIVEAIAGHRPAEAEAAMRWHLQSVQQAVLLGGDPGDENPAPL